MVVSCLKRIWGCFAKGIMFTEVCVHFECLSELKPYKVWGRQLEMFHRFKQYDSSVLMTVPCNP